MQKLVRGLDTAINGQSNGGSQPPAGGSKRRNRRGRGSNGGPNPNSLAPVSLGRTVRNKTRSPAATKSGCDYLDITDFTTLPDGQIIFEYLIVPSALPQLSKFAASYQRIRYKRLVFELSAHMPSNAQGGYIMGFRPDPTDELPVDVTQRKRAVTSTPGSIKNSIWKSATLAVNRRTLTNRLLYTSVGDDLRECSPGSLWIVSDGKIDNAGSLSLTVRWTVRASTESFEQDLPLVAQNPTTAIKLYAYDDSTTMQIGDTSGSAQATWESVFPQIERPDTDVLFKLPVTFGVHEPSSASADIEYSNLIRYARSYDRFHAATYETPVSDTLTFKSPTGNTQIIGSNTPFDVTTIDTGNLNPPSPRKSPKLLITPSTRMLPLGGKTNRLSSLTSFLRLKT